MYDRSLVKETRKKCRQLNYQFTGYRVNGQVRARKSEWDEYTIKESMHDVSNLSKSKGQDISHIKFMFILAFIERFI